MLSMKKIISIMSMFAIITCALMLTGCKKEKKEEKISVVGTWVIESEANLNYKYTFNADGTGDYEFYGTSLPFKYEDKGDKLVITFKDNDVASEYKYRIEGNTIIIKDGSGKDVRYNKQ